MSQVLSEVCYLLFHFFQDSLEDGDLRVGEEGFGLLVVCGNHVIFVLQVEGLGRGR